jgi:hypothetical protein
MTQLNPLFLARSQDTIIDSQSISVATDYNLPSTVRQGQAYLILCDSTSNSILTIKSSNGDTIESIRQGYCFLIAIQSNPTTSAHWKIIDVYEDGIYTATTTAGTGTAGVTSNPVLNFSRKNRTVTVWGQIGSVSTSAAYYTFNISIPISKTFAGTTDASGVGGRTNTVVGDTVRIIANAAASTVAWEGRGAGASGGATAILDFKYKI